MHSLKSEPCKLGIRVENMGVPNGVNSIFDVSFLVTALNKISGNINGVGFAVLEP